MNAPQLANLYELIDREDECVDLIKSIAFLRRHAVRPEDLGGRRSISWESLQMGEIELPATEARIAFLREQLVAAGIRVEFETRRLRRELGR